MNQKKAVYVGMTFTDGIVYALYAYRGDHYQICFSNKHDFKSIAMQHKENQDFIDKRLENLAYKKSNSIPGMELFSESYHIASRNIKNDVKQALKDGIFNFQNARNIAHSLCKLGYEILVMDNLDHIVYRCYGGR